MKAIGYTRALHDYTPEENSECEIGFSKGAVIVVFTVLYNGWWVGSVLGSNVAGFFPSNYCSELSPASNSTPGVDNNVIDVDETDAQKIARLEHEVASLKEQLEHQKHLTEIEKQKRRQIETTTLQQLEHFSHIISANLPQAKQ